MTRNSIDKGWPNEPSPSSIPALLSPSVAHALWAHQLLIPVFFGTTVEAKTDKKLRDHMDAFLSAIGNLQPVLVQVFTLIEHVIVSVNAEKEKENLLLSELILSHPLTRAPNSR